MKGKESRRGRKNKDSYSFLKTRSKKVSLVETTTINSWILSHCAFCKPARQLKCEQKKKLVTAGEKGMWESLVPKSKMNKDFNA